MIHSSKSNFFRISQQQQQQLFYLPKKEIGLISDIDCQLDWQKTTQNSINLNGLSSEKKKDLKCSDWVVHEMTFAH